MRPNFDHPLTLLLAMAAILVVSLAPAQAPIPTLPAVLSGEWTNSALWDDPRTEVALYEGERMVGGIARPHELAIRTVSETLDRETMVRAEVPHGDTPVVHVLRQKQTTAIPAPAAPIQITTSVLVPRAEPANTIMVTTVLQSVDDIVARQFRLFERPAVLRLVSTREQTERPERALADHDALTRFEEELPLLVRLLPHRDGLELRLALYPGQTTARTNSARPSPALLTVSTPPGRVSVPIGTFPPDAVWQVDVEAQDGRAARFLVERAAPRRLLLMEFDDGRVYQLRSHERTALREVTP